MIHSRCLLALLLLPIAVSGQGAYYGRVAIGPFEGGDAPRLFLSEPASTPEAGGWVCLEGPGEGWVVVANDANGQRQIVLHVALPAAQRVAGSACVTSRSFFSAYAARVPFAVDPAKLEAVDRPEFLGAKRDALTLLAAAPGPGRIVFGHALAACERELGVPITKDEPNPRRSRGIVSDEAEPDPMALFSGGRAIAENLRLHRELDPAAGGADSVSLDSIPGISIRPYDWQKILAGAGEIRVDPLASLIPADQHAAFFPGFAALGAVLDALEEAGSPLLDWLEARNEDHGTRERYERQLCATVAELAAALPPLGATRVAITGSDPYFRTGTDVALLIEASDPEKVAAWLRARQDAAAEKDGTVTRTEDTRAGLRATIVETPGCEIRCGVAVLKDRGAVLLTNSPAQLERIGRAAAEQQQALDAAPEMRFFRHRYPLGDAKESVLLVLSDDAIRRLAGPRWRIGAARRNRALGDLLWARLDEAEQIVAGAAGPSSPVFGTVRFQTPISELPFDRVTPAERDAYAMFRESYESEWRDVFDPIAVRLDVAAGAIEADVTVRPLVIGTSLRDIRGLVASPPRTLAPDSLDPHGNPLIDFAIAIDLKSGVLRGAKRVFEGLLSPGESAALAWLRGPIRVTLEDGPESRAVLSGKSDSFESLFRLPLVVRAEVENPVLLAAILAGFRAATSELSNDMIAWSTREHRGQSYQVLEPGKDWGMGDSLRLHYVMLPGFLAVSLREDCVQRVIDRHLDRPAAGKEASSSRWLGAQAAIRVDGEVLAALRSAFVADPTASGVRSMLPLLDEWQRRFPEKDPLEVHERIFGVRLVHPRGGVFKFDVSRGSVVSTTFGGWGDPVSERPAVLAPIPFSAVEAGLEFEEDGIRARARLVRRPR